MSTLNGGLTASQSESPGVLSVRSSMEGSVIVDAANPQAPSMTTSRQPDNANLDPPPILSSQALYRATTIPVDSNIPFYDQDFSRHSWYREMISCICILSIQVGIWSIIPDHENNLGTTSSLMQLLSNWGMYMTLLTVYMHTVICLAANEHPHLIYHWFSSLPECQGKRIFAALRRITLLVAAVRHVPAFASDDYRAVNTQFWLLASNILLIQLVLVADRVVSLLQKGQTRSRKLLAYDLLFRIGTIAPNLVVMIYS